MTQGKQQTKKTYMTYLITSLLILSGAWVAYGYLAVNNIEEPRYTLIKKDADYEIRAYKPYLTASVEVRGEYRQASSEGFRLIADYIFGNNRQRSKISMTAPVIQERSTRIAMTAPVMQERSDSDSYRVSFVMPSEYTLETIAEPKNPKVSLSEIPARRVAVLTFSGVFSVERSEEKLRELRARLKAEGLDSTGKVSVSRYNPPGTPPFMNRHEVWIELKP